MDTLLRAIVWLAIIVALLIAGARYTMLRWWEVPPHDRTLGASIQPTLQPGDWVLLWRLTKAGFGDLVMCPDPDDPSQSVVGRIAGESGDEVRISGSDVYVNGARVRSESACPERVFSLTNPDSGDPVEEHCAFELMGGVRHKTGLVPSERAAAFQSKHIVPRGHVFLLSDNRLFPFDSRSFGPIEVSQCKETVFFRLVSRSGFMDVERRLTLIR